MPSPGFLKRQMTVQEAIPKNGSILYSGTIVADIGPSGASETIPGSSGAVLSFDKAQIIADAEVVSISSDALKAVSGRVVGFGKKLGTILADNATIIADTNTLIVQLFAGSIGAVAQPTATILTGSIVAQVRGV
jgi:hypothetical protein